jgi:hypothetical protein
MARQKRCQSERKRRKRQQKKKNKRWRQQRQQARSQARAQASRRRRRGKGHKEAWWGAWQGGAKGSFKHLHLFLMAFSMPLIGSQKETLAAFVVAALLANSCHLPQIAAFMPLRIRQRSRLRRLERFVASEKVEPMEVMAPIARWLLKRVKAKRLYLILDFTTKQDQYLIAMVSLLWGKRTIPLAWTIGLANTKGVSRRKLSQQAVRLVAAWVPPGKEVVFIADREFRSKQWRRLIKKELKWHFVVRLSADRTKVYLPDGSLLSLGNLKVEKGEAHYWTGVYLTMQKDGPYQLAAVWSEEADEPWLLVSDLDDPQVLPDIYAKRWGIESSFRDMKSYGFDLEASRIDDVDRFNRLLLGLALAYGWAVRVGHWLDQSGQRLLVDRGRTPKQSAYRLGRYWLAYLWTMGSRRIEEVQFANVPFDSSTCGPPDSATRSPGSTSVLMQWYAHQEQLWLASVPGSVS